MPRGVRWFGASSFWGHLRHFVASAVATEDVDSRDWMTPDDPHELCRYVGRLLGRAGASTETTAAPSIGAVVIFAGRRFPSGHAQFLADLHDPGLFRMNFHNPVHPVRGQIHAALAVGQIILPRIGIGPSLIFGMRAGQHNLIAAQQFRALIVQIMFRGDVVLETVEDAVQAAPAAEAPEATDTSADTATGAEVAT